MNGEARPTGENVALSSEAKRARSRNNMVLVACLGAFALIIFGVSVSRLGGLDPVGNGIESRQ